MRSRQGPVSGSPSGTLVFLFTDIEGSTVRWELHPAAMQGALRVHDAILRETIAGHGGTIFKCIGDACCAVFTACGDAVRAAIAIQRNLIAEDFASIDGLRVRIAIHVGVAEERDDDYFGPTLNRVARLLAIAHGGQVLLSASAAALSRDNLPGGVYLRDLGNFALKDLARAEDVFQVICDDLPSHFPALLAVPVRNDNLPLQPNRLIGREEAVSTIVGLIRRNACVTLSGAGGVGKTRTAIHIGMHFLDSFDDGVWFVDLAPVTDATFVASAFAAAFGIKQPSDGDIVGALVQSFSHKQMLIIVDNCEHVVLEAARIIAELLNACASVKVLATSREPLRIAGEYLYLLPSLSFPSGPAVVAKDVLQFEACALFFERATAARNDIGATENDARHIGEICRRLDGIPLAIELAAAHVRMFTFEQLERRLDDRFRLLTQGSRTALPRQRTIRAIIDWSYDYLTASEALLFRRLAVFPDGWTLETAEAVCSDDSLPPREIVDLLSLLVDKSLVVSDTGGEMARFRFLETTKSYAHEKFIESQDAARVLLCHAQWVAELVEYSNVSTSTEKLLERCGQELPNIRAALDWALLRQASPLMGARIAASIGRLCYEGGLQADGRRWIDAAISLVDEEEEPKLAAGLWHGLARLSIAQRGIDAAKRSIGLAETACDYVTAAMGHVCLAYAQWQSGFMEEAEASIERALALYEACRLEKTWMYADALDSQANIFLNQGRFDEARTQFENALSLNVACDERLGAARVRGNLAELQFARGDARSALELVTEAAAAFREGRSSTREAVALVNAAAYHLALDENDAAERAASKALTTGLQVGDQQLCAIAIQHIASAAMADGDAATAAVLLGYVDQWYRAERYEREWSEARSREALLLRIQNALDPEASERAGATGAALSVRQAADRAFSRRLR